MRRSHTNACRESQEQSVRITTIFNKLQTTRYMVDIAKEYLLAQQENARLTEDQFKHGVVIASQGDASSAQLIAAQAKLLDASLDYRLARDELTRVLGETTR
jgi:outer membrane protein TolC